MPVEMADRFQSRLGGWPGLRSSHSRHRKAPEEDEDDADQPNDDAQRGKEIV